MYLKTDDVSLFVQSFGGGKRTIVAQGGWVGSGELWLPVFEGLSKSWRTITYDHRGTGATISRAPRITFDLLVSDLFLVLDRLEVERCVLAGESAGAAVVLEAALRQPGRFSGLVLVDGRYTGDRTPQRDRLMQGCRLDFPSTMAAFVDACVPEVDCEAEREWGKKIVMRSSATAAIELMESMEGIDIESRLGELQIPALVIHGSRDAITPLASSQTLAAGLPHATLAIIDGAGHVPTVTRPVLVAAGIEEFFGAGSAKLPQ
ncbi:alpha/beta fold hydrolase [Bradyrhizobium sp.]|uniref:alpha/beta fold hydrolase n=1 Tax=Bradyrhizobium sp. TaxID=376 RepID=UPI002735E8EE|nr:alpha/beta hydrolase [Bradyrhizobium sp.]MDP3690818.1 alpha/beta hydrolase [Bradyrhizobium sp.]